MSLTPSTGTPKYEVFGAFTIDVVNDTSFIYNQFIDMDEDAYNRYVDQVIFPQRRGQRHPPCLRRAAADPLYLRVFVRQRALCRRSASGQ